MSDSRVKTVKEMDAWEQPREKALKHGFGVLSKSELLALILRTGTIGCPITQITSQLLEDNQDSLHLLMRRSQKEIMLVNGLGPVKAMQVLAILELIKRYVQEEDQYQQNIITKSSDIYNLMRFEIGNNNKEEIWLICLNRRHGVIARHRITRGSATASVFDLKGILKIALLDEAESVALCHNHPSGNLRPSPQDDNITSSLKRAMKTIEINMIDHVIITSEGYYSYADEGRL